MRLVSKYLILDVGAGADNELVVLDLSTRKTVLDVQANEYPASPESLVYWERVRPATARNRPDFGKLQRNGLGEWIAMKRAFSFVTGKIARFPQQDVCGGDRPLPDRPQPFRCRARAGDSGS